MKNKIPIKKKRGKIYMLTSPSGKSYIGKTVNLKKRMNEHKHVDSCPILKKAIDKYGFENFKLTILFDDVPQRDLNALERHSIWLWNTYAPNGYNASLGGEGNTGLVHTDETKKQIADTMTGKMVGENHPMYGKKHTEESLALMSEATSGENNGFFGKTHTDEARELQSKARQEYWANLTPEEREDLNKKNKETQLERWADASDETRKEFADRTKSYWDNLTPEEYDDIRRRNSEGQKKYYANLSPEELAKRRKAQIEGQLRAKRKREQEAGQQYIFND